jgi:type IV secretion system protein VirB10
MKALEKERLDVDEERRRHEAQRAVEQQVPPTPVIVRPSYVASEPPRPLPVVDAAAQREKEREERAPFASSIVIEVTTVRESTMPRTADSSNREESPLAPQAPAPAKPDEARTVGSGKFLPAKEGDLFRIYEGTLVPTTLVNRLDGTFTGPVKCAVSQEVKSADRKAVLIPAGSQFLGEARRVDAEDQRRLAIVFKRLLLPNGYSIDLPNDPGLSEAGETGVKDKTSTHVWKALGLSGAVGLLGGLSLVGGQLGAPAYASGVASSTGNTATNILSRFLNVMPTITIREGHAVVVYISTDLLVPE